MFNIKLAGCVLLVVAATQVEAHGGCAGFGSVLADDGIASADTSILGMAATNCTYSGADQTSGLVGVTREISTPSWVIANLDTHYYTSSSSSSVPPALQEAGHVSARYEAFWQYDDSHHDDHSWDDNRHHHDWHRWHDWNYGGHETAPVPLPATAWLTLSALIGLVVLRVRRRVAIQM